MLRVLQYLQPHKEVLLGYVNLFQTLGPDKAPSALSTNMPLWHNTLQMCPNKPRDKGHRALPVKWQGKLFHSQPSDSEEPKDRGHLCQLTAAGRRARPGHASTCTARGYPVSCADMLTHPQGEHSLGQALKGKLSDCIKPRGHTKHPSVTEKRGEAKILLMNLFIP